MTDNNEDNRRKKEKKFLKHFDILINGKKVKILNYKIKDYKSVYVIEFISQLKFDKADLGEVDIQIVTDKEKLDIKGIAVPGMPVGTPGMEMGNKKDSYAVVSFDKQGQTKVFKQYSF